VKCTIVAMRERERWSGGNGGVKLVISIHYSYQNKWRMQGRKMETRVGYFTWRYFPRRRKDIDPRFSYKHELRDRITFYIE
jgi:hypothetical protein